LCVVLGTNGNTATFSETVEYWKWEQQKKIVTTVINPSFATSVSGQDELISKVYQEISEISEKTSQWLEECVILAPKNDAVCKINKKSPRYV